MKFILKQHTTYTPDNDGNYPLHLAVYTGDKQYLHFKLQNYKENSQ